MDSVAPFLWAEQLPQGSAPARSYTVTPTSGEVEIASWMGSQMAEIVAYVESRAVSGSLSIAIDVRGRPAQGGLVARRIVLGPGSGGRIVVPIGGAQLVAVPVDGSGTVQVACWARPALEVTVPPTGSTISLAPVGPGGAWTVLGFAPPERYRVALTTDAAGPIELRQVDAGGVVVDYRGAVAGALEMLHHPGCSIELRNSAAAGPIIRARCSWYYRS